MRLDEKKKVRGLVTRYIIAFLFAFSWVAVGIALALSSAKLDLGGKVDFVATDIYATITGNIEGTITNNNLPDIELDAEDTTFETPSEWKGLILDFDESNEIVVTITIKNLSDERAINVTFTDNISSTNTSIVRAVDSSVITSFGTQKVSPSQTKVFTITMKVENRKKSAGGDFILTLNLVSFYPENEITALQEKGLTVNQHPMETLAWSEMIQQSQKR